MIIMHGENINRVKRAEGDRRDRRFAGTGDHDVYIPVGNGLKGKTPRNPFRGTPG